MPSAAPQKSAGTQVNLSQPYLFFRTDGSQLKTRSGLPPSYVWMIWRPSRAWPSFSCSLRVRLKFVFRFALFVLGLFADDSSGAVCILHRGRLVHYSAFTPRYWRFPFLEDRELQIGDTWTDPVHRGNGLASRALRAILELERRPGRRFWYVVGRNNAASVRVVEKAGFHLVGDGAFERPLGLKLLGSYRMGDPRKTPITRTGPAASFETRV